METILVLKVSVISLPLKRIGIQRIKYKIPNKNER